MGFADESSIGMDRVRGSAPRIVTARSSAPAQCLVQLNCRGGYQRSTLESEAVHIRPLGPAAAVLAPKSQPATAVTSERILPMKLASRSITAACLGQINRFNSM